MNNNNPQTTLDEVIEIKSLFNQIYDENLKPKIKGDVFNQKIKTLNDFVYSERIGLPKNANPKQIEIKIEQLYELLTKVPKFKDQTPNDSTKTEDLKAKSFRSDETKDLQEKADAWSEQKRVVNESSNQKVRDFEKRNQAIYEEKQKIKDFLEKSSKVSEELKKTNDIYLKVEEIKKDTLTENEKIVFDNYKNEAINDPEVSAIKLAREIHSNVDPKLGDAGLSKDEIDGLVNTTAQRSVDNWVESQQPGYITPTAYNAINNGVLENLPKNITGETQEVVLSSIKISNTYKFQSDIIYKEVLKGALGIGIAEATFGSGYNVSVLDTPENGYDYRYNLSQVVESSRQIYKEREGVLEKINGLGQQETQNYLFNQSATYFTKSSIVKKILVPNSKTEILFFSTFKNAGKTVTWTGTGALGKFAAQSGYAPLVNIVTGTKFVTPVITKTAAKVATKVAAKTGIKGLVAAAGAGGTWASFGLSAAAAFVTNKIIDKLPQIKKWFSENSIALGAIAGLGGAVVFGATPGLMIGIGAITLAGGLGSLVSGTVGVMSFIASSLAITVATPVIVTLVVLPPLIGFIMLVINNSSYIVPPSISTLASIGQVVSPYIDIQKVASPEGPFENTDLPKTIEYTITIKAKKGNLTNIKMEDECSVRKKSGNTGCPPINPKLPETSDLSISPTEPFSFTYSMMFNPKEFADSRISNSIKITATADGSEASAVGSSSIKFGNPPEDCPADWPVYPENEPYLVILQGPHTTNGTHNVIEAIDIFSPDEPSTTDIIGNQVKATHQGDVVVGSGGNYGRYVDITSMCKKPDGKDVEITTRYAHLSAISVTTGQIAGKDQTIGLAGSSGTPYPHLHYEFRDSPGPLPMKPPYLPKAIPVGCFNAGNKPCGITY